MRQENERLMDTNFKSTSINVELLIMKIDILSCDIDYSATITFYWHQLVPAEHRHEQGVRKRTLLL